MQLVDFGILAHDVLLHQTRKKKVNFINKSIYDKYAIIRAPKAGI